MFIYMNLNLKLIWGKGNREMNVEFSEKAYYQVTLIATSFGLKGLISNVRLVY